MRNLIAPFLRYVELYGFGLPLHQTGHVQPKTRCYNTPNLVASYLVVKDASVAADDLTLLLSVYWDGDCLELTGCAIDLVGVPVHFGTLQPMHFGIVGTGASLLETEFTC